MLAIIIVSAYVLGIECQIDWVHAVITQRFQTRNPKLGSHPGGVKTDQFKSFSNKPEWRQIYKDQLPQLMTIENSSFIDSNALFSLDE